MSIAFTTIYNLHKFCPHNIMKFVITNYRCLQNRKLQFNNRSCHV